MTQGNSSATPPKPIDSADPDPLMHLHKMSTTAGLGSQEYVAVNTTAVVAVLFGIASILAMLGNILLIIPVVGVILSIVALRQIRNSNGTQTGRPLAYLGLALSALITAGLFTRDGIAAMHTRADQEAINALFVQFGQNLANQKFDDAYNQFDDEFKARVAPAPFKIHLSSIQNSPVSPAIQSITGNGLVEINADPDSGLEVAEAVMLVTFTKSAGDDRMDVRLRKIDGKWLFDNIPTLFPKPRSAAQAAQ